MQQESLVFIVELKFSPDKNMFNANISKLTLLKL